MFIFALVCIFALAGGAFSGKNLAAKGVNSDNALKNHQRSLIWIVGATAPILGILIIIDKLNLASLLPKIFPPILLIYLAAYFDETIVIIGFFCLGFLVLLELSNKHSRPKIRQLIMGITSISCALSLLLFFLQPVRAMVGKPKIINGVVVMQTTLYTCAPSSIATLARFTRKHPQLTELDTVELTKTNRFGTTTLAEIQAMKKLGLNPEYRHNLTLQDLIALHRPALLHVKEKNRNNQGVRFSHTVAFLSIDAEKELLVIANPLYGIQIKTFRDMQEYWFGEAILAN